jgi:GTP-binding protein EngB required for normal cell division
MPHSAAREIAFLIEQYLRQRHELKAVVLLVDARRGPQKEEFALTQLLRDRFSFFAECPRLIVVATKCDKLKRAERQPALQRFEAIGVAISMCSSVTGEGIEQVRRQILGVVSAHHPEIPIATGTAQTPNW